MWKKEDVKSQGVAQNPSGVGGISTASPGTTSSANRDANSSTPASSRSTACIGQGIRIKGEVTGSEDLFVDGYVEGKLNLSDDCCVTIGPNGEVKADIFAREVIVRGRVDGKIVGREKIQLWSTGNIAGDLKTERLTIEDGAILRGRVEIETGKPIETRVEARGAAAGASGKPSTVSVGSGSAAD
jgi:cytoskeletal protein CcmA (bactofilin family)